MAHITGGGIPGNLGRPLPAGLGAEIDLSSWERPAVFSWLASLGVDEDEMRRVFNLGLGYAVVVADESTELALRTLEQAGERAWVAGRAGRGRRGHPAVRVGVLISGTGSNLQALIDDAGIDVACVVSDRAQAAGLERAARAGIESLVTADEAETAAFLERHEVGLVVLAGYMRILSAGVRAPLLRPHHERAPVAAARVPRRARGRGRRWRTACA